MPSSSFGHNPRGINLQNLRQLGGTRAELKNGYVTSYDWAQETVDQIGAGNVENKLSSTLRHASNKLQAQMGQQVTTDIGSVEDALKAKMHQTASLKALLEGALTEVLSEIEKLVALRGTLDTRQARVGEKQELNAQRLQVRAARPARERTMDDVEKDLLSQSGLLISFAEKVKRSVALIDKQIGQLDNVRGRLEADLRDKAEALRVDEAVLSVTPGDAIDALASSTSATMHPRETSGHRKAPHTWARASEDNVHDAHHWLGDSIRLRKAVASVIVSSRAAEQHLSAHLNTSLLAKVSATTAMRSNLEAQLTKVREEESRALAQRASLATALEAQGGPLAQAKERYALRKSRPAREAVHDDVEMALAREIAHLYAASTQLADKVKAADREISQLNAAAMMIEDNLQDKGMSTHVDEAVIMLDGRIHLSSPPPASVASMAMSDVSVVRAATLQRIKELEHGVQSARQERLGMEATIAQLRSTVSREGLIQ